MSSFHLAKEVLRFFRDRFISEVDASAIVMDLLHWDIIDEGDKKEISIALNPVQQRKILHLCLMKKCTNDALKTACDVMIGVAGNPKMVALGADMKKKLEAGKCCVCVCVHSCECVLMATHVICHFVFIQ